MRFPLPLTLGTAQLGMDYGVINWSGQPSQEEAQQIVAGSWALGIRCFDTAQAYGESEAVLGRCLGTLPGREEARVITKLHPRITPDNSDEILVSVIRSLKRLGIRRLWGLMIHDESHLDQWTGRFGLTLCDLQTQGVTEHLGVSVYSVERALQALQIPALDILQIPSNVFDRRFLRAGVFRRAMELKKTVFVRSVFLQGLVFPNENGLTDEFAFGRRAVHAYRDYCGLAGVSPCAFALSYALQRFWPATFVLGAETNQQITNTVENLENVMSFPLETSEWDKRWPQDDPLLVNPALWPLKHQ